MKKIEGWICPNCKRGVAPTEKYCDCVSVAASPPSYPTHPYAAQPWGGYWKWMPWYQPTYWSNITVGGLGGSSNITLNDSSGTTAKYIPSDTVTVNSPQQ